MKTLSIDEIELLKPFFWDIELKDKDRIDFIKIDVEGFELKVLNGGRETIRKHKPLLLVELHPVFITQYGNRFTEVIDFLEGQGYKIEYHSFTDERRLSQFSRIVNRWSGNPGKLFSSRKEFLEDVTKTPALLSPV